MTRTIKTTRYQIKQDYFVQCFNNGYLLENHNTRTFRLFGITFIPNSLKRKLSIVSTMLNGKSLKYQL